MCFSEGDLGYFFSAFRCEKKYSFGDSTRAEKLIYNP